MISFTSLEFEKIVNPNLFFDVLYKKLCYQKRKDSQKTEKSIGQNLNGWSALQQWVKSFSLFFSTLSYGCFLDLFGSQECEKRPLKKNDTLNPFRAFFFLTKNLFVSWNGFCVTSLLPECNECGQSKKKCACNII